MDAKVMKEMLEVKSGSFEHIAVCETLSAFGTLSFTPQYAIVLGANTNYFMFQTFLIKLGETQTFSYIMLSDRGTTLQEQGRVIMTMSANSATGKASLGFQYSPPYGLQDIMRVIALG